jgi:hypothetical protein
MIEKIDSDQNFMIFSDSASVLKGIRNSCKMNNTSHIIQMLKDKIERLDLRGKKSNFTGSWGTAELKLRILKPTEKRKAKENFTVRVKIPNGREGKTTLKGTTGMAFLRGSAR